MKTLVDSNVVIDLLEQRPFWMEWSMKTMDALSEKGPFVINQIIFGEVSIPYDDAKILDAGLRTGLLIREDLPWHASFVAGKAFRKYITDGGRRSAILSDFLIGAHASVNGYCLLTRDGKRYRTYFPEVEVIAPDTHP
jgi:predicted nucleic acid-binding protein